MTGDARTRHCEACGLNVHNISAMTETEIGELVGSGDRRVCVRLFKRADGTVLTRDCPRGLSAYRKRVATFAGAALTAVLGLFSVSFGQRPGSEPRTVTATPGASQTLGLKLSGIVTDPQGAIVPRAQVRLLNANGKVVRTTVSNDQGIYGFETLDAGEYIIEITLDGFKKTLISKVRITSGDDVVQNVELQPAAISVIVGIMAMEEPGASSAAGTTTIIVDDQR